ncbi:hypothetical protein [Bacillus sp. ISL-45]|uniref:hypothetical protein n=1 Tax=Bacillus sp. ISL-45 TaxID=2819128 RepID=UPI001BEC6B9B|nr:hypothetical protein [Bacillus sp. ISL-45]MBT2663852.1 hypothetical protein [Bacillus sp. ISL-45]
MSNSNKVKMGELVNTNDLSPTQRVKTLVEQGDMTVSQAIIEIAQQHATFFITENEEVFASVKIDGNYEHFAVNSDKFKKLIRMHYYQLFNKPIGKTPLSEAIETIVAIQEFNFRDFQETFIRVGKHKSTIYLDLGTPDREIVEVDNQSWRVIQNTTLKFVRPNTYRSLPIPVKGGSIKYLDKFININDQDRILVYSFLLSCLSPTGPYPILIVQGPQGSGKSFFSRLMKSIIDPTFAPIRSLPRNEEDLMISAQKSRLLAFDNLSGISNNMSDSLCKLSTGGGFSTRKFYENTEEVVLSTLRPIILNGIDYIARRPDLADRAIIINLSPFNSNERLSEDEILKEFEDLKPKILGGLLDALSIALGNLHNVKLDSTPRMADFAKLATAAETGFGFKRGTFMNEYIRNRKEAAEEAAEHDLLVSTIIDCLDRERKISGTATFILERLRKYISVDAQTSKQWIKSPNQLKDQLTRIQPILTANNISYVYIRNNLGRIHSLEKL